MNGAHLMLNVFALLIGLCHFVLIAVYFGGLVEDGTSRYVSNLISSDALYMNLQTLFVLLQFTCCFGFVRFHATKSTAFRVAVETMFLIIAWVGWLVLILCYGSVSELSGLHFCGVGLFFCGVVVYFMLLIFELYSVSENMVVGGVLLGLYFTSIVFGTLFMVGFFNEWGAAWVFEHLAFMTFALSHVFLFAVDVCADVEVEMGMFKDIRIGRRV